VRERIEVDSAKKESVGWNRCLVYLLSRKLWSGVGFKGLHFTQGFFVLPFLLQDRSSSSLVHCVIIIISPMVQRERLFSSVSFLFW